MVIDPAILRIQRDSVRAEYKVKLTNRSDVPLTPKLICTPPRDFEMRYAHKAIKPGESTDITIRVSDLFEAQTSKKTFTFEFDDAARTRFSVPVEIGTFQPPQTATGAQPASGGTPGGH
jgi:hypothetical protein